MKSTKPTRAGRSLRSAVEQASARPIAARSPVPVSFRNCMQFFLLITLLLLLVYSPSFNGPLAFDDFSFLSQSQQELGFPPLLWHRPESRPLVMLGFALEEMCLGPLPWVHRVANTIIHALAATFLFVLVHHLCRRSNRFSANGTMIVSVAIAGLWAVHPLQTQAVAYIIQRAESQMGLFYFLFLLSLCLDQQSVDRAPQPSKELSWLAWALNRRWLLLSALFFIAGLWSKTVMITALAVAPLMDRAWLSSSWHNVLRRRGWLYIAPLLAGSLAIVSILPGLLRGDANVGFGGDAPPLPHYLAAQAEIYWRYLALAIVPTALNIDHGLRAPSFVAQQWFWIILSCSLIVVACVLWLSGRRQLAFLLFAPLLVLSPTSSLVPTADLMVEHRVYVSLSAWIAMGLLALNWLTDAKSSSESQTPSRIWVGLALTIFIAFSIRTWLRAADYESGFRLWSQSVLANPDNDRAIQNLIEASRRENLQTEVVPLLLNALEICDARAIDPLVPLQRLGEEMVKLSRSEEAVQILVRCIELDQTARDSVGADGFRDIHRNRDRAAMHTNLAVAYLQQEKLQLAYGELVAAFPFSDQSADRRAMAGEVAAELYLKTTAREHFERALALRPNWEQVQQDLLRLEKGGGSQ